MKAVAADGSLSTTSESSSTEYELITEGKYKDVLAEYSKMTEPNYSSLNPFLLKRLKDEDLPLFLNFEWYDLKDEFESRFKSGGKLQPI